MQAQQAPLKFSEAEQPRGDRLLKIALETDRVEGYSEPHSILIARLATSLGERMGIHGIELSGLKFAALAHDIGERAMKRNYLLHSYQLTWEETLDLWRHPILGEQAAAELGLSRLTQLIVRWHHEWWNGHGYPDSLQGPSIPLAARILRVVDSYCALISNRPHRMRFAPSEAEQIIADLAGIEFDPFVVKLMLELLSEKQRNRQPELRSTDHEPDIYLPSQEPQQVAGEPEVEPLEAVTPKQEFIKPEPEIYPVPTFQESQVVMSEPKAEPIEISLTGQEFIEPDTAFYPVPPLQEPQTIAATPQIEPIETDTQTREYLEEVIVLEDHLAISEVSPATDPHLPAEIEPIESESETLGSSINISPTLESSPQLSAEESPGEEREEDKVELPTSKSEG